MEKLLILQGMTAEQFFADLDSLIQNRITELLKELRNRKEQKWLTRKETAQLLHITLPTLHDWSKRGLLKSHRIGNRILYDNLEVEKALDERNFRPL